MSIRFKTLEWSNMFSYGPGNQLDLTRSKIAQLTGLNGHGKTSISLILQELLYSKNIKGIKKSDILHRYSGSKTWKGRVVFEVNKNEYDLRVERTGESSKVKLLKDGEDISEHKIPDTYKKLQQLLGMSFEVFSQLVYQSSTDLLDFIKATDTNRKRFLINLFGLDEYLTIGEQVKLRTTETEAFMSALVGELNGVKRFLEDTVIGDKRNLREVSERDEASQTRQAELKVQLDQYNSICTRIEKNLMLIKERDALVFDLGLTKPEVDPANAVMIKTLEGKITSVEQQIRTLEQQKSKIDTKDTCYACGQHLDNSKSLDMIRDLNNHIGQHKESLDVYSRDLQGYKSRDDKERALLRQWNANQKAIEKFEQLSQVIDKSLPLEYPDYKAIEQEYKTLSYKLNELDKLIKETIKYNEQVHIHNTKVETLREQKREFLARQELLEKSIIDYKTRINHLTILKKAFSTSGIVAFKLENLTKQLEATINSYLAELSDGQFQIIFRLTGEKLNIIVSDDGKEAPIETISGGEFGRIQTSILLAIRNILSKIGGNEINVLFLDEITGVLDAAGKERLVDILLEEGVNTFFISHDFEHPLIDKIAIVKENKISKIIQ